MRLRKRLSNVPPGSSQVIINTLEDLAQALEYVARMVPADTKTPIPPAIWDVGPTFTEPEFRDWLQRLDKRDPGRLTWLAEHRGEIARALKMAEKRTDKWLNQQD